MAPGGVSGGILLYRRARAGLELLVAHPGGPFWAKRDAGAWSIPKGEVDAGEEPLEAAIREFAEETGMAVERSGLIALGSVTQKAGKVVHGWAVEGHLDPAEFRSSTFVLEWPPRSGRMREFPEIDRVRWVGPDEARILLNPAQAAFVGRLVEIIESLDHGE